MKKSTVITIMAVIVALIVVYAVQQINRNRQKAAPEGQFVKITPKDMKAADIQKIKIYRGDAQDDAIVLARGEDGWIVPSRFGSKGKQETITEFLNDLKKLTGELRTTKKSLHADFGITDQKAIHIALYDKKDKLYQDVLVGKKGDRPNEGFVRLAKKDEVYLADRNLLNTLGIYSEGGDLDAKRWLDLKIMDEDLEKAAKLVLDMPGKQVVLEKVEKKKEEEEAEEEPTDPAAPKPAEEKKEYEWVLVSPETEFTPKTQAAQSPVRAICTLSGSDVADPAKMDEYGFETPTYTATLTLDNGSEEILLVGTAAEGETGRYAKLKEGKTVYIVPSYTVTSVFKKMRDFLDIKIWDLAKDDVASIGLQTPDYEMLLERRPKAGAETTATADLEWVLAKPETPYALKDFRITSILNGLAKPTPDDLFLTGEPEAYGLDDPEYTAVLKMKDEATHTVHIGKKVEDGDDRYVKFEGKDYTYSLTKYNFEQLFPTLAKLLTIEVVKGLTKDDITSLEYRTPDEEFVLSRQGAGVIDRNKWSVKVKDQVSEAKGDLVDGILDALLSIQPEDMVIGKSDEDCGFDQPTHTLAISTTMPGEKHVLLVGKEVSEEVSNRYFKIEGQPEAFVLSETAFDDIFMKLSVLQVAKPVTPPSEEDEEKPSVEETPPAEEQPSTPVTEEAPPTESVEGETTTPTPEEEPKPSAQPEKEQPAAPESEGKEEKKPASPPDQETPAPGPPAEEPSIKDPKKELPPPPIPKPSEPRQPIPLPPTPGTE